MFSFIHLQNNQQLNQISWNQVRVFMWLSLLVLFTILVLRLIVDGLFYNALKNTAPKPLFYNDSQKHDFNVDNKM